MKIVLESFMTARPNVFKLLAQCYVELPLYRPETRHNPKN
jgi:hypothetical protein